MDLTLDIIFLLKASADSRILEGGFTPIPRRQKLYPTVFNFTEDEFNIIWSPKAPKSDDRIALRKRYRQIILSVEASANKIAEGISSFSFEEFERKLFRKSGEDISVKYHYAEIIDEKSKRGLIGSVVAYESSMKSIASTS